MSLKQEWVAGIHAVTELINHNPGTVIEILLQEGREDARVRELENLAREAGLKIQAVSRRLLDDKVGGVHQGVAACCMVTDILKSEAFLDSLLNKLPHAPLLLLLDEITDPHNMGACLRSADAAGVDAVLLTRNNSAPLNMTVRKVASGAAETVCIVGVSNLSRSMKMLKQRGIWLVGTAGEAETSLYQQDLTGPLGLVMGSEGKGLRRLTREGCDYLVSIPMAGDLSSLNVSVATGICLFEAVRQRQLVAKV